MQFEPEIASFTGVVKTLLWLLIGWFIYRTVASSLGRRGGNRSNEPAGGATKKGEVRIDRNTPPKAGKVDESAEFVDFEEVQDNNNGA
jgi:hypothetical protein